MILSHNFYFLTIVLFKTTIGKRIGRIYKYDQRNWPYPSSSTNFFIPQPSDTSIKTQRTSAYYSSISAHDLASSGLYHFANHHVTTDVNDNDDSQSFETPRENNWSYSCFRGIITTTNTPYSSTLPTHVKECLCFQIEDNTVQSAQCAQSRDLIKVMISISEIESFAQQCVIIKGFL